MRKRAAKRLNKKNLTSFGIAAAVLVLVGGGYYYSTGKNDSSTASQTEKDNTVQESQGSDGSQAEQSTQKNDSSKTANGANTTPQSSLTSLPSASITATKDSGNIILFAYGIEAGTYEVEKNGKKITLASPEYVGHGGLSLPDLSSSEKSATYQIFLLSKGTRVSASKIITVTTNFVGVKEFKGA